MPAGDAFFVHQAARHADGFVVGDFLDAIHQIQIEVARNEAGADAWILCGPGFSSSPASAADDRRVGWLDRHGGDGLAFGVLDVAADAGQRAAGADAGDEYVDVAVGVFPDFRAGGFSWIAGLAGLLNCCRIR